MLADVLSAMSPLILRDVEYVDHGGSVMLKNNRKQLALVTPAKTSTIAEARNALRNPSKVTFTEV